MTGRAIGYELGSTPGQCDVEYMPREELTSVTRRRREDLAEEVGEYICCSSLFVGLLVFGSVMVSKQWMPEFDDEAKKTWVSGDCRVLSREMSRYKNYNSRNQYYQMRIWVERLNQRAGDSVVNVRMDNASALKYPHMIRKKNIRGDGTDTWFESEGEANRFRKKYEDGELVTCFWDPNELWRVTMTNAGGKWRSVIVGYILLSLSALPLLIWFRAKFIRIFSALFSCPGGLATKHPNESHSEFYERKGLGLTYWEVRRRVRRERRHDERHMERLRRGGAGGAAATGIREPSARPQGAAATASSRPGDLATKHPDESYSEFYSRKGVGRTYWEVSGRPEPTPEAANTEVNLSGQGSEGDEAARLDATLKADVVDIGVDSHGCCGRCVVTL